VSSSAIRIRNARGELVEPARVSSSDAKNRFGRILERVTKEGGVAITLRNEPRFVVISVETYQRMARADSRSLDTLTEEFDALLDRMQAPGVRAAMERAFSMTPEELGDAARRQGQAMASRPAKSTVASDVRKGQAVRSSGGATVVRMRKPPTTADLAVKRRSAAKRSKHRTRG
jgi:prevent-host-death family protein